MSIEILENNGFISIEEKEYLEPGDRIYFVNKSKSLYVAVIGNDDIVKGVNIRKKHVKPRKQGEEGGIIPVECAINSSKVNVVCSKCGKATKIGYVEEKGEKVRVCKKCGAKLK